MEKCFNIAGPCFPDEHYMLPALERLPGIMRIAREMALGSKRLDLCVEFGKFRYAVELKMKRNFSPTESPAQLVGYLDHLKLPEGWMAIFDDDASKSWDEKIYTRDEVIDGKPIHYIGL